VPQYRYQVWWCVNTPHEKDKPLPTYALICGKAWPGVSGFGQDGSGSGRQGKASIQPKREKMNKIVALKADQVTNGGEAQLEYSNPYQVMVAIDGVAPILFHRWNCEAVETKAKAAKGSRAKKTDDIESFIYRNDAGHICLPGEYLRQSIITAAKFKQDPRSPRKSAMDLFKAGIVSLTPLASLGKKEWDFIDQRRVTVQRNGITRMRPAMREGWKAEIELMVNLPEYIPPMFLRQVLDDAGRLVGVGDFRPTYGRFTISQWIIGD
jgi:hypothetical protein